MTSENGIRDDGVRCSSEIALEPGRALILPVLRGNDADEIVMLGKLATDATIVRIDLTAGRRSRHADRPLASWVVDVYGEIQRG